MKYLLLLLLVGTTILARAGSFTGNNTNGLRLGYSPRQAWQTPAIKINRSVAFKAPEQEYTDEERCIAYRKYVIIGSIAVPVGAGLIGGGAYLLYYGDKQKDLDDAPFVVTGAISILTGIVLLSGGIPVLAIGVKQMRNYCNNHYSSSINLSLINRGNTAGVALRF